MRKNQRKSNFDNSTNSVEESKVIGSNSPCDDHNNAVLPPARHKSSRRRRIIVGYHVVGIVGMVLLFVLSVLGVFISNQWLLETSVLALIAIITKLAS